MIFAIIEDAAEAVIKAKDLPGMIPGWALFAIFGLFGLLVGAFIWQQRHTIKITLPEMYKSHQVTIQKMTEDHQEGLEKLTQEYRNDMHKFHAECAVEKKEQRDAYLAESKLERDLYREDLKAERESRERSNDKLETALRDLQNTVRGSR